MTFHRSVFISGLSNGILSAVSSNALPIRLRTIFGRRPCKPRHKNFSRDANETQATPQTGRCLSYYKINTSHNDSGCDSYLTIFIVHQLIPHHLLVVLFFGYFYIVAPYFLPNPHSDEHRLLQAVYYGLPKNGAKMLEFPHHLHQIPCRSG